MFQSECAASEVDSLHALLSSRLNGLEPGIEHLVPKPALHQSTLSLQQVEETMGRVRKQTTRPAPQSSPLPVQIDDEQILLCALLIHSYSLHRQQPDPCACVRVDFCVWGDVQTVDDLRSLRRALADEYAKGLSNSCITQ